MVLRGPVLCPVQAARDSTAAASEENNRARGKKAAQALQDLLSAPQVGHAAAAPATNKWEPLWGGGRCSATN
jgi:hypothetical protein